MFSGHRHVPDTKGGKRVAVATPTKDLDKLADYIFGAHRKFRDDVKGMLREPAMAALTNHEEHVNLWSEIAYHSALDKNQTNVVEIVTDSDGWIKRRPYMTWKCELSLCLHKISILLQGPSLPCGDAWWG